MNEDGIRYIWTDAWVLQAVIYADKSGGADLRGIIAAGDTINQAVFRREELESGLYRLAEGGWIEDLGKKFRPAAKARSEHAKIPQNCWSMAQEMELIAGFLGVAGAGPANEPSPHPENKYRYPGFSEKKFQAAVQKYLSGSE